MLPMMESHVLEAVRNNIVGTWNLVRTARRQKDAQSVNDLVRQSCQPDLRDGRDQARLRTDRLRPAAEGWRTHQVCFGAFWERPGQAAGVLSQYFRRKLPPEGPSR